MKPLRAFALRRVAADGGGVGHHVLHLGAGAVARLHRQERDVRQRQAHLVGVVRGDPGRADLLQQDRFQVGQLHQAAGDVGERLAGADPVRLPRYIRSMSKLVLREAAAARSHSTISRGAEITGRRRNTA